MKPSRLSSRALDALRSIAAGVPVPPDKWRLLHKRDLVKATGGSPKRITVTPKGEAVLARYQGR